MVTATVSNTEPSVSPNKPVLLMVFGEKMSAAGLVYRAALSDAQLYQSFGGSIVISGAPAAMMESVFPPDLTPLIVRFPNMEAGRAFWLSEEHQALKRQRDGSARFVSGLWKVLRQPDGSFPDTLDTAQTGSATALMLVNATDLNLDRYRRYLRGLQDERLLELASAVPLAGGPPIALLEGSYPENRNTVLLRFPSLTALNNFWDAPSYTRVKGYRVDGGNLAVGIWLLPNP